MRPLKDRCVVLGITGGIAAYKAADLVSRLKKMGADVKVIMTRSAAEFIAPLTLQSLSQNPVAMDMFEEPRSWEIRHISLAQSADVFVIAPCTANVIGKIAGGLADDLLTTTVMATKAPVLIAPAMNTNMYENPIVQQNIQKLTSLGYTFIAPESGRLACGDIGRGKLADPAHIAEYVQIAALRPSGDLRGRRILVTAGATQEALDPVRYLTNHSSGKMGYAVANAAYLRGADVVLVSAPSQQAALPGVTTPDVVPGEEEIIEGEEELVTPGEEEGDVQEGTEETVPEEGEIPEEGLEELPEEGDVPAEEPVDVPKTGDAMPSVGLALVLGLATCAVVLKKARAK